MPKSTHFHTTRDVISTDKKFRPEDEGLIAREKQEFQQSETDKHAESRSEAEFISEQDENAQDKNEKDKSSED